MYGLSALLALLAALAATAGPEGGRARDDPWETTPASLAACDEEVRTHPDQHQAYHCYLRLAHAWAGGRAPVLNHLQRRLERSPDDLLARLWLGILAHDGSEAALAESALRPAADAFQLRGAFQGEVLARSELSILLCYAGREAEALPQLGRLSAAAEQAGDPELRANAILAAAVCARKAHDHGRAIALYTQALQLLGVAPRSFRTDLLTNQVLDGLGSSYSDSGRHREAFEVFRKLADVAARDPFVLAIVRHRLASQSVNLADEGELEWDEVDRYIRESLEMERRLTAPHWPPFATRILDAARRGPSPATLAELDEALAFWRPRSPWGVLTALRLRAKFESDLDPAHPRQPLSELDESLAMARDMGNHWNVGMALLVRAHVHRRSGARAAATADSVAALDELDRLRDLQVEQMVRSWTASETSFAYQLVAGWMLDRSLGQPSPEALALAFAAIERNRARALLEGLASSQVDLAPPPGPLRARRDGILTALTDTQRRLLDPTLPSGERAGAVAELARLENAEEAARDDLVRHNPRTALRDLSVPTLAQVQAALGADEALLSFETWRRQHNQDATFEDGSSWVLVITRDAVHAVRIPDADVLRVRVDLLRGLIDRRDGSEASGAAALYRDLLAGALRQVSPHIQRLVILPDGPLHLLPFEVLRKTPEAAPLGLDYAISVAPSAALWLRWRARRATDDQGPRTNPLPLALVLANPSLPGSAAPAATRPEGEALSWLQGARLHSLPFADAEARAISVAVDGRTRILEGPEATERFLKTTDLSSFRILHLAAHALVDELKPERTAVVLAPGGPDEDGLLQLREVVGLDLAGKLVVLAACSTSTGAVLGGEGPLSLARAFFQAGAPTVLGSLWPLRDDEAAALMAGFYRALGDGLSTSAAMAQARREHIGAGRPAAAWAGMVVLGDGDFVPLPRVHGARDRASTRWLLIGMAGAALALGLLAIRWRRRMGQVEPPAGG